MLAVALLTMAGAIHAQSPKRSMRSIWLTSYQCIDWPSQRGTSQAVIKKQQDEIIKYLDDHKRRNFNGVCFHVRTWSDALYKSSYEPWSEFVSGKRGTDPGWDPLAFVVEEGHKRGLEVYAWVNPYRFNRSWGARTTPQDKEILSREGWIINQGTVDQVGQQTSANEYQVYNPALPEVREYLLKVFREIYMNYRIDGMLFDDYFYPNGIPATTKAMDYKQYSEQNPGHKTDAATLKKEMGDWRRANVNLLMHQLYEMIQNDRPDLRFGLSPAGIAYYGAEKYRQEYGLPQPVPGTSDWQYNDIYSDPIAWLAEGSVDFISPQIYWFYYPGSNSYTTAAPYEKLVDWWSEVAKCFDRHLYVSMGSYRMSGGYNNETHWADISKQIETNRRLNRQNASGEIYFSAKYMDGPYCSGWGDYLQTHSYQNKALLPLITWKNHPALSAPEAVREGDKLVWTVKTPAATDPIMRYTVYAVPAYISKERACADDGDGISNAYLMDVSYSGSFELPAGRRSDYWYAVCAYDGYGYESAPCYIDYPEVLPPAPTCKRDATVYPTVDGLSITNLWYRSNTPDFANIDFIEDGKANRSIAISGDCLYLAGRTAHSSDASAKITVYDLRSGEELKTLLPDGTVDSSSSTWACNDICSDSRGRVYFTNLTINAGTAPLTVHRLDTTTGTATLVASLKPTDLPDATVRFDHATVVDDPADADRLYVYAATASGTRVCRWTLDKGNVSKFEYMTAKGFYPASSANFGIAPRVAVLGDNRIVVNGGAIHPTEYDFATGTILSDMSRNAGITPSGTANNGFAHFGPAECYMAYAQADHTCAEGYKFAIVSNNMHGFDSSATRLWTVPSIDMGSLNSTTYSTPVATVTVEEDGSWVSYVALLATGNTLAVYKVSHKEESGVESIVTAPEWRLIGRTFEVTGDPADIAVYTLAGSLVGHASMAHSIEMPTAPGVYIVRYGNAAARVAVR